jgi:hypothetical protein
MPRSKVPKFLGIANDLAIFTNNGLYAAVNTSTNFVEDYTQSELSAIVQSEFLKTLQVVVEDSVVELAEAALLSIESITAGGAPASRLYTIPGGVQAEAKKALKWRHESKRGGTPVGLNTARTLAKGGQIGIEKVRHIAKYFPRHEVDKKGKGWEPGEEHFPSNGRIAWALWGGDAGQRWASAIVERENKKALTSGGYALPGYEEDAAIYTSEDSYGADISAFKEAHELDPYEGPEFMVRVRLDDSGIDRLYKIDIDGQVYLWDGSAWDNLGHVDGDVYSYDQALDDPYDTCEKTHVIIDPSSAVIVSAFLQERPFQPVTLDEIDPEETQLMSDGLADEDFTMIDRVMTAAGEPVTKPATATDGNYTPEERAKNTQAQPRDAGGLFVKVGSRTVVGGDARRGSGTITDIDSTTGKVRVRLDSGKVINVDAGFTQAESSIDAPTMVPGRDALPPIDFGSILGEPRTPIDSPIAHLPGTLPKLTTKDIHSLINGLPAYYKSSRDYKLLPDKPKGMKAYDKKYIKERYGINAAATPEDGSIASPAESDVTPKYLALVSPDDMTAVMDVVALVPASSTSTETVLYERREGKWQPNSQILSDLKSATPPPVIELDTQEILNDVLKQADDASKPVQASAHQFSIFWERVVEPLLAARRENFGYKDTNASLTEHSDEDPCWDGYKQIGFKDKDGKHVPNCVKATSTIAAAGGLDRNRGNAEALREYWTHGKGAAKIRWGTPGDWTRCVRNLSKYMGVRAKGYCQLRHKEVTGVYTGSRMNPGHKNGSKNFSSLYQSEQQFADTMIEKARLSAIAADAREKISLIASANSGVAGSKFSIPMLVPEGVESGDGRKFAENAISVRELPVPLLWQIKTGAGHDGSVVVGRIDYIERIEGGMGNASGVFDSGPYGREAERLVRNGFLRGVSVDLDKFEAKEDKQPKEEMAEDGGQEIGKDKLTINKARIMAATIVAKPAFQECSILLQKSGDQEDNVTPEDGVYEETTQDFSDLEPMLASGFLESEIPMTPPADWFENPGFTKATPLTVDADGRVYGHIAAWNVNHIGLPRATKPPRSRSKYAYFHTGVIRTEAGTDVPVGQLTLAGGHAPLNADAMSAAKHYDDTASAVADIHVGEDEYGIWCAGSLRPGLEEMQIRALRASAPSGDWRPIQGSLELVAICQVNVPGFPTARAMIASGKILALVAAGANYMALMKSHAVVTLTNKADLLGQLANTAPDLKSRVREAKKAMREANLQAITASAADLRDRALVAAAIAELATIPEKERLALAKEGKAMPDGSFPIRNEEDLKNAIHAYGRAKASDRREVRKHITKQARSLKRADLIPEQWKNADSMEAAAKVASMRATITASANSEAVVAAAPKVMRSQTQI